MAGGLDRLIDAAKAGDEAAVRALVEEYPELVSERLASGESALMAALYRGHRAVVDVLIALGADLDVFAAAATGRIAALESALADPAAVNAFAYDGWTPLHLASFFGHADAARRLLQAGADVHAISRNSLANTALHAAAAGKHPEVARLLLERGADPHVADAGGFTAATIAAENGLDRLLNAWQNPENPRTSRTSRTSRT